MHWNEGNLASQGALALPHVRGAPGNCGVLVETPTSPLGRAALRLQQPLFGPCVFLVEPKLILFTAAYSPITSPDFTKKIDKP